MTAEELPPEEEDSLARARPREREIAKLVAKLHENMGHLSNDRMIVMLKAAGAKEDVMEFVKKRFSCELCSKRQKEVRRRVAAYPRTYTFNRIVAVDGRHRPPRRHPWCRGGLANLPGGVGSALWGPRDCYQ